MNTPSTTPQVFSFNKQPLRGMMISQKPWIVAKDLCAMLDIGHTSQAVRPLDDDEKLNVAIQRPGGGQRRNTLMVSESGLYALVFKSRKPEAKAVRKWVTDEVLPAIRRGGTYVTEPEFNPLDFLNGIFGTAAPAPKEQYAPVKPAAPKAKALPSGLPAGVLDARAIPTTTVGLLKGKVRMVSVAGQQWYCAADVLQCMGRIGRNGNHVTKQMPIAHRAMVQLFGTPCPYWFVTDTGLRLILGARSLLNSQLSINLD